MDCFAPPPHTVTPPATHTRVPGQARNGLLSTPDTDSYPRPPQLSLMDCGLGNDQMDCIRCIHTHTASIFAVFGANQSGIDLHRCKRPRIWAFFAVSRENQSGIDFHRCKRPGVLSLFAVLAESPPSAPRTTLRQVHRPSLPPKPSSTDCRQQEHQQRRRYRPRDNAADGLAGRQVPDVDRCPVLLCDKGLAIRRE
jgi:hypothetical protein